MHTYVIHTITHMLSAARMRNLVFDIALKNFLAFLLPSVVPTCTVCCRCPYPII